MLERLAQHLTASAGAGVRGPRIVVVDAVDLGAGRVWRTDQPAWFTMNTVVGELTMAPDGPTAGPIPTFLEWLGTQDDPELHGLGPHDVAARHAYGHYLHDVYERVLRALGPVAEVEPVLGQVTSVRSHPRGYAVTVCVGDGEVEVIAQAVVLATGHPSRPPRAIASDPIATFAAARPELTYLAGELVTELDLDCIRSETAVGVIGLGLSFYDLMLSLTVGRGGEFEKDGDQLRYRPSGKEPLLFAGSRGGIPIGTRGRNQKGPRSTFRPRIFTSARVTGLREDAVRRGKGPRLDFSADVLPLLLAEIELVRASRELRRRGADLGPALTEELVRAGTDGPARARVLRDFGLGDLDPLDPARLARPFAERSFAGPAEFTEVLHTFVLDDIAEAELGNTDGALKAGLDVIRESRDLIRAVVECDGLAESSTGRRFHADIVPWLSLVSTGPPPERTKQFVALSRAGVVTVVGPQAQFGTCLEEACFTVESPLVAGSRRHVQVLVDTRLPRDLGEDDDPLVSTLLEQGLADVWRPPGDEAARPSGLRTHPASGRLLKRDGSLNEGLYAIGIPTEGVRWFTQIGNGRPSSRTAFHREADAIALDIVRHRIARRTVTPGAGRENTP